MEINEPSIIQNNNKSNINKMEKINYCRPIVKYNNYFNVGPHKTSFQQLYIITTTNIYLTIRLNRGDGLASGPIHIGSVLGQDKHKNIMIRPTLNKINILLGQIHYENHNTK